MDEINGFMIIRYGHPISQIKLYLMYSGYKEYTITNPMIFFLPLSTTYEINDMVTYFILLPRKSRIKFIVSTFIFSHTISHKYIVNNMIFIGYIFVSIRFCVAMGCWKAF